jgi:hypothetical protein
MQASVPYSEFVATRLASPSHTQVILGLGIIYFHEFLRIHLGPVLYGGLQFILKAVLPTRATTGAREREDPIEVAMAQEAIKVETEKYKSAKEDKKSSKGSENDIYMLKTHGYNKYRFVSEAFIRRNKLKATED